MPENYLKTQNDELPFTVSVVIPAYNEGATIAQLLAKVREQLPSAEILVIDDCSQDNTAEQAQLAGAKVLQQPLNKGNGAAVKTGIRQATGDLILLLDADGQMNPNYILLLLQKFSEGYDLVVGTRTQATQGDTLARRWGNQALDLLGSYLVEQPVRDLTSGFRVMRRSVILEYIHLLPNRYSYPTTSTLAFVKGGYSVGYVPIEGQKREAGRSNQQLWRNGLKFGLIILRMISLFAPLRVYFPVALLMQFLAMLSFLVSFLLTDPFRFHIPNSAVALFVGSIVIFMFGLLAEQLAALRMQRDENKF